MAGESNILKGVIDISAPGAQQTLKQVASEAKSTEKALQGIAPAANKTAQSVSLLQKQVQAFGGGVKTFNNNLSAIVPAANSASTVITKLGSSFGVLAGTLIGSALGNVIGNLVSSLAGAVAELFTASNAFDENALAIENYANSIKQLSKDLDNLKDSLDFASKLRDLNAEIKGLSGASLNLFKTENERTEVDAVLEKAIENRNKIRKELDNIRSLFREFGFSIRTNDRGLIPDFAISEASEGTKKFAELFNNFVKELQKTENEIEGLQRKGILTDNKIQLDRNKQAEESRKKEEEARKKYLQKLKADLEFEEELWRQQAAQIKKIFDEKFNTSELDQKLRLKIGIDINADDLATNFAKEQNISSQLQKRVDQLTKSNPILIRANAKIELTPDEKALSDALKNINDILAAALRDSLVAFGEGLGEALAGGDIQKAFQGFASVVGGAVKAIGEQLIALGTAAVAAKIALNNLFKNPALQIAAGVALVAIGTAMQSLLSGGIKGFAVGGYTGSGGRNDPAGIVHKGEFVIPQHAVNRLGIGFLSNLAFGNGIRGYANGGLVGAGISGSGIMVRIVGETTTRGQDLITVLKAAERSQSRLT